MERFSASVSHFCGYKLPRQRIYLNRCCCNIHRHDSLSCPGTPSSAFLPPPPKNDLYYLTITCMYYLYRHLFKINALLFSISAFFSCFIVSQTICAAWFFVTKHFRNRNSQLLLRIICSPSIHPFPLIAALSIVSSKWPFWIQKQTFYSLNYDGKHVYRGIARMHQ